MAREVNQLLGRIFAQRHQEGRTESGGRGDRIAVGPSSSRGHRLERTAAVGSSGSGSASVALSLWPPGAVSGTALQARADRGRVGGDFALLLLVLALSPRTVPGGWGTGCEGQASLTGREPHVDGGGSGGAVRSRPGADGGPGGLAGDHQGGGARTTEAVGDDIAQGEQGEIQAWLSDLPVAGGEPVPILYVQMDATGVPSRVWAG